MRQNQEHPKGSRSRRVGHRRAALLGLLRRSARKGKIIFLNPFLLLESRIWDRALRVWATGGAAPPQLREALRTRGRDLWQPDSVVSGACDRIAQMQRIARKCDSPRPSFKTNPTGSCCGV